MKRTSGRPCCCRRATRIIDSQNTAPLVKWLEESFNANKPWDRLATDLLTASGGAGQERSATT